MNTHFTVAGKPVRCSHCEHTEFEAREILLNTRAATFFNFDWLNRAGTTLTCRRCTRIEWFNLTLEEMANGVKGEADKPVWVNSKAVEIDLGLQVADGEKLQLSYVGQDLLGSFQDWRESATTFRCSQVIAFKWQPLELLHEGERPDSTYEILDSEWVQQHAAQGAIGSAQIARHFKLNFNAIGCLEVICAKIEKASDSPPGR